MRHTTWQPSETAGHASLHHAAQDVGDICDSITAYTENLGNVLPPIELNSNKVADWPDSSYDAVLCANMVHISPFSSTLGLLRGASKVLCADGYLFLYGPFSERGQPLSEGNRTFDESLRSKSATWGLCEVSTGLTLTRAALQPCICRCVDVDVYCGCARWRPWRASPLSTASCGCGCTTCLRTT